MEGGKQHLTEVTITSGVLVRRAQIHFWGIASCERRAEDQRIQASKSLPKP